jgi:glycosyltransferase involved in cell wall biosynthesis
MRFGRPKDPTYLAVSNAVADIHGARGIAESIEVVPNFLDPPDDPPTPTPTDGPVLYVGPSNEAKGFTVVSEAHRLLVARGHAVTLRHVGGDDVSEASFVIRSGRLEGSDVDAAFRSSRLVIVPSIWEEPCPTVALEAMARGRAVVASRIGGLTDIVEHGTTGLLVRPNHPGVLADAIESLLDDPELTASMGMAGRERFLERFSTERVGPMIERAYATACR